MELSQRSISHRVGIGCILFVLIAALIASMYFIPNFTLTLLMMSLICLSLIQFLHENTIMITESGIACLGKSSTLWAFDWDEIEALTPSRRERIRSVELKVTSHRHMEILSFRQYETQLYFQLDKKARKALAQYAPARLTEKL